MKKIIFLFIFVLPLFAEAAVQQVPCGGGREEILRRTRFHAAVAIDQVMRSVNENLSRSDLGFNRRRKLNVAAGVLRCARGKLATLVFVCGENLERTAYTVPFFSKYVYIRANEFFSSSEMFPRSNVALFVHEATHHCGTTDAVYLNVGEKPRDSSLIGWQMIADTYQYWVESGFYLPQ